MSQVRRNTLNSSQMNYCRIGEVVIGSFITYSTAYQEKKLAKKTQRYFSESYFKCPITVMAKFCQLRMSKVHSNFVDCTYN